MSTLGQDAPAARGVNVNVGARCPGYEGGLCQRWGKMPRLRGWLISTLGQDAPAARVVNANVGARCSGYEGG